MLIKRWAALFLVGTVLTGLALAMGMVYAYRYYPFPESVSGVVQVATLQFMDRTLRFAIVLTLGFACLGIGFWRLSHSLISPLLARTAPGKNLAQVMEEHRFGRRRPALKVVAIGGGTGLSTLLRGLKQHDLALTAIVTVADDGGSTGRIRSEFDIPAPGDIRNCLVALADDESLVSRLFQYRFDQTGSQLNGHSFGNLFITALTQVTGSFEQAVRETAHVLAIRGDVLPSTVENVTLCAELLDDSVLRGESSIAQKQAPIKRVYFEPRRPAAYEPALEALLDADLIVLGPGSLYTSVLPNLLVEGLTQAIRLSLAPVIYVCNVATQPGETDHFTALDHVRVILDQIGVDALDGVVVNSNPAAGAATARAETPIDPVTPAGLERLDPRVRVVARDVLSERNPLRHDPAKLAAVLLEMARSTAPSARLSRLPLEILAPIERELVGAAPAKE